MKKLRVLLHAAALGARAVLLSPIAWLMVLAIAGASLITAGTALLVNAGAALIVAGAFLLLLANFIRKGLN